MKPQPVSQGTIRLAHKGLQSLNILTLKLIVVLMAAGISALLLGPGCATSTSTTKTMPEAHQERAVGGAAESASKPTKVEEILAAASLQQDKGNLELSSKILASAADQFTASKNGFTNVVHTWHRLDQDLSSHLLMEDSLPHVPDVGRPHDIKTDVVSFEASESQKSWDQTQGEKLLRDAFKKAYAQTWYYPGFPEPLGYWTAEKLWKKQYVDSWLMYSSLQVSEMEEKRQQMVKPSETFDLVKKSENELLAKLDATMAENFKFAQDLGPRSRACRRLLTELSERRTEWISYALISPYLGYASLSAWESEYDENKWGKAQTLKTACRSLGRCDKEMLLQCNEEVRTQFAEAYGDIKKACGKDTELFEYLKVYQNFVEALKQGNPKKGASRWLEE